MDKIKEQMLKDREPVCDKCLGQGFSEDQQEFMKKEQCSRIIEMSVGDDEEATAFYCSAYIRPSVWWNHPTRRCPMADHYRPDLKVVKGRARVGQQKQRKR